MASLGRVATDADGPAGPFPPDVDPDTYDRLRRRVLWRMPTGLYLLGSRSGEERNLMTLNWAMQVSSDPKLVAVSVEKPARTHRLLSEGGVFALSILDRADRAVVRAFVKPAAWDPATGTLNGHEVRDGPSGAPVLAAAVSWVDCRLRDRLDCGSHTLFVGEVIAAGEVATPAGDKLEVLRTEDTRMNYGG